MKKLLLIAILFLPLGVYGQCVATVDDPCVSISQSDLNKATSAAIELKAARDVIAKFAIERATGDVERAAAHTLIKSMDVLLATKDRIIGEFEKINALYRQVIDFQTQIITNLEKQLLKPKSGFQKVLDILKTVGYILTGVALGRVF